MRMQEPRTVFQEKCSALVSKVILPRKTYFAVCWLPIPFLLSACIFERMKTGKRKLRMYSPIYCQIAALSKSCEKCP